MKLAGMIVVRKDSNRVPNKALRPFGDSTLFEISLKKFQFSKEIDRLYVCAHEDEFLEKAHNEPMVTIVERSYESAHGETMDVIYDFLDVIEEEWLVNINVCCPFTKIETFDSAIRLFRNGTYKSLIPVTPIRDWVFSHDGRVLNRVDPEVIDSKQLEPVYKVCHPFVIYNKARVRAEGRLWGLTENDPYHYEVSDVESIDIDYISQFEQAEALYFYLKERNRLEEYMR